MHIKNNSSSHLNLGVSNKFQLLNYLKLFEKFNHLLAKKRVLLCTFDISNYKNIDFCKMTVYLLTSRIKTLIKVSSLIKKRKRRSKNKFRYFLKNSFLKKCKKSLIKTHLILLKLPISINYEVQVVNKLVNLSLCGKIIKYTKYTKKKLFSKMIHYYYDMVKLVALVSEKKVDLNGLLVLMSWIYSRLVKHQHKKFFYFFKGLFAKIVDSPEFANIRGIRYELCGRLGGKTKGSTLFFELGRVNRNSYNKFTIYRKRASVTVYGTFGHKLWISYN